MGSVDDYRPEDLGDFVYDIRLSEMIGVTMGPFGSWVCTCENCEAYRQHKTDRHDRTHPGNGVGEWKTDRLDLKPEDG